MERFFVVLFVIGFVASEDKILECDEFAYSEQTEGMFCTVTGFVVNHNQRVVIHPKNSWTTDCLASDANYMKFYDSSLLYIPSVIFGCYQMLRNLDASDSGILELPPNTFTNAKELKWLNISCNSIERITTSVFLGAKQLHTIDISFNRISELNEHSFNGLEALNNLVLKGNKIVSLPANLFSENPALIRINCNQNRIEHLDPNVFKNLNALTSVDLSENKLVELDSNMFYGLHSIHTVDLAKNQLKNLVLNIDGVLGDLRVNNNQIEKLFINCSTLQKISFDCILQTLDVSHNDLTDFRNITHGNLRVLNLSYNRLGKVNFTTFSNLPGLQVLYLRHTNFSGLTFGTFAKQTQLKILDLAENQLHHLNLDMLLPYMYQNLEELYISGNNLTEISGRHRFASFVLLKKLDLRQNNFNCSYLFQLVTEPYSHSKIDFRFEESGLPLDREHIHGIECENKFNNSKHNKNENLETVNDYEKLIHIMKLRERQMEQHQQLLKFCIIVVAALGLATIGYKCAKLISVKRNTWVNAVSYRSTNTIQSDVDP